MQRAIKAGLKACDLFAYDQFTLYRSKENYSTLTGGVASVIVLGVLIAIFLDMAIGVFSYSSITAATETIWDPDPYLYS